MKVINTRGKALGHHGEITELGAKRPCFTCSYVVSMCDPRQTLSLHIRVLTWELLLSVTPLFASTSFSKSVTKISNLI